MRERESRHLLGGGKEGSKRGGTTKKWEALSWLQQMGCSGFFARAGQRKIIRRMPAHTGCVRSLPLFPLSLSLATPSKYYYYFLPFLGLCFSMLKIFHPLPFKVPPSLSIYSCLKDEFWSLGSRTRPKGATCHAFPFFPAD